MELIECPKIPGKLTLSPESCANYHIAAQKKEWSYRLPHCVECPIGAANAGIALAAPFQRRALCLRCGSGNGRQILGRLCMSCYNREIEHRKGKNSKGGFPRDYRPLVEYIFIDESSGRRYLVEVLTLVEARLVAQKAWGLVNLVFDRRVSALTAQLSIYEEIRITHAKAPCGGAKVDQLMVNRSVSQKGGCESSRCTV